ncbi:MAG: DinB family protein [Lewinella sp.]
MTSGVQQSLSDHKKIRHRLLTLVDKMDAEQLCAVPPFLNNHILWNVGHIVAVSDLLTFALGGHPTPAKKDFIGRYRPGTKPVEGMEEDLPYIRSRLTTGSEELSEAYDSLDWSSFRPYTTQMGVEVSSIDHAITFNNTHEALHFGTMLAIRKWVVSRG